MRLVSNVVQADSDIFQVQFFIRLGDKELDYNFNFKLYITTKLANPHFPPEISTKTTIINFAVKESSLENQLLTLVVKKERPDLDKQRNELIVTVGSLKSLSMPFLRNSFH
jgi:dynein heavy chain